MLNDQTRHRIRLARRAAAYAAYELTNDDPGVSARDIYMAITHAEDALEDALDNVRVARAAIEGIPDSGTNDEAKFAEGAKLKVAAREARARVEGHNARCAECDTYYNRGEDFTCPLCGCGFHWNICDKDNDYDTGS